MHQAILSVVAVGIFSASALAGGPGEGLKLDLAATSVATAMMQAEQDAAQARAVCSADSFTWNAYGSAIFGDSEKGEQYAAHTGFSWYFLEDLGLNLEAFAGYVDPERDDSGGVGGLDLTFRWHFHKHDALTIYVDGGAGFQQASTNFPSDNHFNFRTMFGLGASYRISDGALFIGGVRYVHISNAGLTDGNDGLDGAMVYLGLSFPF